MNWLHPTYAWAVIAVPAAVLLCWRAARWRQRALDRFGERGLVQQLAGAVRPRRRVLKAGLVVTALACAVGALVGPRVGTAVKTVERTGVDLVVAIDVSASMRATDVAPSRLRRAKEELRSMVDVLDGDRVGLVLFAGDGFVQCPLTTDYEAVRLFLDVAGPDQMPTPGTNVGAALDAADQAFDTARPASDSAAAPGEARSQVLLVLSDGENHIGDLEDIRAQARADSITMFTAGVGTAEGARVPLYEDGRRVGWKRGEDGSPIRTALNEPLLQQLASDGAYFRVGATGSALADVPAALQQLDAATFGAERFADYRELYQWPLALALVLLVIEAAIPVRRRREGNRTPARVV